MSPPTAYATAVSPPGNKKHDIVVFGCTGNAGRAVAYHAIRSAVTLSSGARIGLSGRSRDRISNVLQGIRDELSDEGVQTNDLKVEIVIADASDETSMLNLAKSTNVLISCAGPYGRYGEATVKACVEGGAHYLDITGEVPWVERMVSDYGKAAEENGVALCPFSGYDCVPAELGMMLVGKALETEEGDAKLGELSLAFRGKGGGFPRGTLETMLDFIEGKAPQRKEGDVRFYPKEYRGTAKNALSPLGFVLPKWSSQLGLFTGPNFMSGINVPVLCRAAPVLGFPADLSISDRSVVSGRPSLLNGYGLFATQLYISALLVGGISLAFPPFRWWLKNKLKTYSYAGDPAGKVFVDAHGLSACKKASATAHCIYPGDPGIYATGLFAAAVANSLLEATRSGSLYPPLAGFHSPVAALLGCRKGLLVDHLKGLGAEIKVEVFREEGGVAKEIDASELHVRSRL